MKTPLKSLMIAALVLSVPALAETVGGTAGKPVSSSDASCANYNYGILTNACTTTKAFIFAAPYDGTSATRSYSVVAKGVSATTDVSCKVSTFVPDQSIGYTTAYANLTDASTVQTLSIGSLPITAGGQVYFLCNLAAGAKIISFSWTE